METGLLLNIALMLLVTKLLGIFTRKIHLPQVVGSLFAGIILGPAILNIVEPGDVITVLAEFGVILLMFSAGLETDFEQLRGSIKASLVIAVLGVILPLVGGFILATYFGQNHIKSIFIGVILTATSVSITVETLQEMGKLKTKAGTAILGAAVIDDILGIIILSVIMSVGEGELSFSAIGFTLLKIAAFFVLALVGGFVAFKLFEFLSVTLGRRRRLSIFGLAFCFFLAYVAEEFGVADITGAYIAGLVLCNSKAEEYIEEKNTVLSYMFFSPIFFISVGLRTSFGGLNADTAVFAALLLILAVLSKVIGCGLGAVLCRFSRHESIQVGIGMISRGEVAIIVATKGITAGLMEASLFSSVILVVIATTLITPMLLKLVFTEKVAG